MLYTVSTVLVVSSAGVYILENTPPRGGKISADVIWGKKYEKVERKRGENVKEKGRKGKEKGRKGKGKKYHFQNGGGGINIVFGPKYRPLLSSVYAEF